MKYFMTLFSMLALMIGASAFAAINVSMSVSPNPALVNQPVYASVTMFNTGASSVNLTNLQITANYNGNPLSKVPFSSSVVNLAGPNAPVVALPPGTNVTFPVQAVFFSPSTGITSSGTGVFYIGAAVYTSDGAVTNAATAAQETVNYLPFPATQQ
jgi:hypothetical protein